MLNLLIFSSPESENNAFRGWLSLRLLLSISQHYQCNSVQLTDNANFKFQMYIPFVFITNIKLMVCVQKHAMEFRFCLQVECFLCTLKPHLIALNIMENMFNFTCSAPKYVFYGMWKNSFPKLYKTISFYMGIWLDICKNIFHVENIVYSDDFK